MEQGREGQAQQALQEAESGAKELWEWVAPISASESSQKLSRVLTQPLLQIKITAGQRGGLALFGVGQTCPPPKEFPLGQSPRDSGEGLLRAHSPHWESNQQCRTSMCPKFSLGLVTPPYMNMFQLQKARLRERPKHTDAGLRLETE